MRALAVIILASWTRATAGQYGMPSKPKSSPSKADLPAIKCGVCEALAEHMHEKVSEMRQEAPFGKVHEDDISSAIEGACDPATKEGRWITQYDIVEEGGYLELKKPGGLSHCKEECETIAKSCSLLVEDELDVEELVVALWRNKLAAPELAEKACGEWSDRCEGKRAKAPGDRQDSAFEGKSDKDFEIAEMMEELQKSMGGMGGGMGGMDGMGGMGGPGIYGPDDMAQLQEMMGQDEGDDFDPMMGGMGGMGGMEF